MAACGGLRTATKRSTPNMPRFEIVNVPPSRSSCFSLFSRVRPTTSARSAASCGIVFVSQLRRTGTTRPLGIATAMPTLAVGWRWISSPAKSAFTARWRMSATAQTFVRMSE